MDTCSTGFLNVSLGCDLLLRRNEATRACSKFKQFLHVLKHFRLLRNSIADFLRLSVHLVSLSRSDITGIFVKRGMNCMPLDTFTTGINVQHPDINDTNISTV
jgi:hypothetical protein